MARPHYHMARILLLGSSTHTWREWIKEHRKGADLICLDPADSAQDPPGSVALFRGNRASFRGFYGSLDPTRAPHVLVAHLSRMLAVAAEDAMLQIFPVRRTPLLRQMTLICGQLFAPDRILVAKGKEADLEGFPVGPEEVELEPAFPAVVQQAQRKAKWLKLIEQSSEHCVEIRRVAIEGARLGAGDALSHEELAKTGLASVQHAEIAGGTLLLVADDELEPHVLARALDLTHTSRAAVVAPGSYRDLVCSFARPDGDDFGFGAVRNIDFQTGIATVTSTAVAPAPVRILRLGGLRVDAAGRELGEVRPWSV